MKRILLILLMLSLVFLSYIVYKNYTITNPTSNPNETATNQIIIQKNGEG
ncbi:MAG: hypothetical protein O2871_00120 [bacterium]|nr:hypothetical protein [bacterium]